MVTVNGQWVEFTFYRPEASKVCLAGEFNDWNPHTLVMAPKDGGYWTARIKLPVGEFRFRYYSDGQWFSDYAAFGVEPDDMGGLNSICRVEQTQRTVKMTPAKKTSPAEQTAAA